jgi:hypothetical protein
MRVLVTGASGNAGQVVCQLLHRAGLVIRRADVAPPPNDDLPDLEFVRCDTRTSTDVLQAISGCTAVVHLAAWHSGHHPPVSDATIFAVNVDGTFIVRDFQHGGADWCEMQVPSAKALLEKYAIALPDVVEQHDLSEASRVLGWTPQISFVEFLRDLKERDARGEDLANLWAPGQLSVD